MRGEIIRRRILLVKVCVRTGAVMTPIAGRLSDMYGDLSKKKLPVNQANQFHHSILQPVYKCRMLVKPL